MTTEQKIRELADKLTELADFGGLTRVDALKEFTVSYQLICDYDAEAEVS